MDQIIKLIRPGARALVTAGGESDGDAIGSGLALCLALRERGLSVTFFSDAEIPYNLSFLSGASERADQLPLDAQFELCFVCDTPDFARLPAVVKGLGDRLGTVINIDHHPTNTAFGDLQLVDPKAAAAGVVVYRLLQAMEHPISQDIAACLYASILTDTGSFRYNSTDPEALKITGELIACGVQPWEMASRIYETQPEARVRLLASALSTLEMGHKGRYATLTVRQEALRACGATVAMLDGFVNHARAVDGVEIAALFVELPEGGFKVSFRSRGNVPLHQVGESLGGKGSHNAASAHLTGELATVKDLASKAVDALFSQGRGAAA